MLRTNTWIGNTGRFRRGGRVGLVKRGVVAVQVGFYVLWLRGINLFSLRRVTGDCDVDVSLTTYGNRVRSVWSTVESIGRGTVRPRRIILWIEDPSIVANPPAPLRRLRRRGLEIKQCDDFGPHKKYYPYLLEGEPTRTLVTADDDMYYPRRWLENLLAAHRDGEVTAYRARLRTDGPYASWPACTTDKPSDRVFATGVSGVAYPSSLLSALRARGDSFMDICPRADDFWLHFAALATGLTIRQVANFPADWWPQLRLAGTGLWPENLKEGGNDAIAAQTARAWLRH
ncbi:hypothetical protein MPUL_12440 [Mycolicibacterium pulveris]|uniref:Glycosyl transferase n=1 Tax=Mycolicibacterium pulveris TaxID=36813 RepID=A0A7I7UIV1_MYCPV|nr:hypothetical protein MPUL_12440 [Mycolicibacterium pulveris]